MKGRSQVGLGPAEIHRSLGVAAHESDVLGHIAEAGLSFEQQQVVAGGDARLGAGVEGLPHGRDRDTPIQVAGPALRGILDADVQANHAQLGQAPRECRREGVGAALAHEGRALHARIIQIPLDCLDPRQAVGGPGQKEVLVVEAEDCAAAYGSGQHSHLGRDIIRRSKSQKLAVCTVGACIAQDCRDRAEAARSPAAAATAHWNKGNAHVPRVRPIALDNGQGIKVLRQKAWCGPHHRSTRVAERKAGHLLQASPSRKRREQIDDRVLPIVEDHAVYAIATSQNARIAHGGEMAPGCDVSAKPGVAQGGCQP
jgi:hypothetical protein